MKDIITHITEGKGRVRLVINDDTVLWLSLASFRERPLAINDILDLAELKSWLLMQQYPEALHKAVGFLALRPRSRHEIRDKLEAKGYMTETIDMVLIKLEKENILDDEAFARDWVNARIHRQMGKSRMMQELRQKGVSSQIAEQALADVDEDELAEQSQALATKLLRRHQKEPDSRKAMDKVMAAMVRRGFSYSDASKAIASVLEALQADEE